MNFLFIVLLICITLFFTCFSIVFLKMNEKALNFWEKLPRQRTAGGIIGIIVLLAFIPNVKPLFSPEGNLYWLIPAALILGILCWIYLDLLFARAIAGAIILLVHWMLTESFHANLRFTGFFAFMSLIWGTYAICIAAKPYWLRDSFRLMCRNKCWRLTGSMLSLLWALSSLFLLIQQIGRISK